MSDHLKILHIISELTPGGAEKVVLDLAEYQSAQGHDVTILSPYNVGPAQVRSTPDGVAQTYLADGDSAAAKGRFRKYFAMLRFIVGQRAWINGFDTVHLHLTFGAIFGWIYSFIAGADQSVLIETNHSAGMPMNSRLRRIRVWMARRFDHVVLVVEDAYWQEQAADQGIALKIIPNGIEPARYELLQQDRTERAHPTIGTVGMFRADRKPWVFLDIFEAIAKTSFGPKVGFLMVGDGPLREDITEKFSKKGMQDQVTFFGVSSFPAAQAVEMEIFISVNVGSLTGMAGIEAAFAGVPLVGYQMSSDYTAQADDWIWSSHDAQAIADHVAILLSDPQQLAQLRARQNAHVYAHHSLVGVYEKYNALYQSHLQKDPS